MTNRDGAMILHYYSVRNGLEHIVLGIVKTVARKLLNTEVGKYKRLKLSVTYIVLLVLNFCMFY